MASDQKRTCIVKYSDSARKEFKKIDKHEAKRIIQWLETTAKSIKSAEDMKTYFLPYRGDLKGLWKKQFGRKGKYRLICSIDDNEATLTLLLVKVGIRKDVYS